MLQMKKEAKEDLMMQRCHQELKEGNEEETIDFCFAMMERANDGREFIRNICFSTGVWKMNTDLSKREPSTPQKVNVGAGIGPFFIEGTLTGEVSLNLLQDRIEPALNDAAREDQVIWFQMNGFTAAGTTPV
ncbi:hypothetical protein ILUMI_11406 [Ignelater luminosus]|uniref:Uncharacterized protein n=1 Tax=Ignelater luminosus TaxID=2038154 RepID=A0A8K0GD96_IGNLU|nr:hypothetical protein ILUMI_11406 [Ignelater luminosus]